MTKIKICGLRRKEDIHYANRCLPDYVGFVFAPSQRQITADTAAALKDLMDPRVRAAGVFVNQDISMIADLCRRGIIDLIQLHGDEDAAYIAALRKAVSLPVIRAVSVQVQAARTSADPIAADAATNTSADTEAMGAATNANADTEATGASATGAASAAARALTAVVTSAEVADMLLFDAAQGSRRGGAGQVFDWQILREIRRDIPQPFFLAGGLTPKNLAEAIQLLAPYGVDLSSGVETNGWKDFEQMKAAVQIAHEKQNPTGSEEEENE